MHRPVLLPLILLALAAAPLDGARAQAGAPHSWLFGSWTGGLFPAPPTMTPQACFGQPTVIFTRDVVIRAQLTEVTFAQRVIVTARTNGGQTEFRFTPAVDALAATGGGLLGLAQPKPASGFGCESADVLHVHRVNENEITFPGCSDFPNPLVRCLGR